LKLKGNILFETKNYQAASKVFQQLCKMEKNKGQLLLMFGYSAMNAGQLNTAQNAFIKAKKYKEQYKEAQKALRHLGTF